MVARLLIFAVCWLPVLGAEPGVLYPHPVNLFDSGSIGALATADFDDDGNGDLAVGLLSHDEVVILLGRGDGSHRRVASYALPSPGFFAVGDFDRDGHEDLAVSNFLEGSLSVLLGVGDGSFTIGGPFGNLADQAWRLAVGDFDLDGMEDVLVASPGGNALFPGNGDGSFAAQVAVPGASRSVAIEDFDDDGFDDFAEPLQVLLGDGAFGFTVAGALLSTDDGDVTQVAAEDLDGDGDPDLVVAGSDSVSIFLASGDGTFLLEETHDSPAVSHVSVLQADGDGLPDLVTTCVWSPCLYGMNVLRGLGAGRFAEAVHVETGNLQVYTTVTGDFDNDGVTDVGLADQTSTFAGVVRGKGDGSFEVPLRLADWNAAELAVVDVDLDGRDDFLRQEYEIAVGRATGAGSFEIAPVGGGPSDAFAVGDLNGDGLPDVALIRSIQDSVSVLDGDGEGGFTLAATLTVSNPTQIRAGDLNGDGIDDLAVVGESLFTDRLFVFVGTAGSGFTALPATAAPGDPTEIVLGHLDGDDDLDLIMALRTGGLSVRRGRGDGTFDAATSFGSVDEPCGLALADFDGDSHRDLAVASDVHDLVQLHRGQGDGSFVLADLLPARVGFRCRISAADLDEDARPDLTVVAPNGTTFFPGNGDASFGPGRDLLAAVDLAVGDFDLDAHPDLLTGRGTLLFNRRSPDELRFLADGVTLSWPATIGAQSYALYRGALSELPAGGEGSCISGIDDDDRDTYFVDGELPAAGAGFFYLVEVGSCP